MSIREGIEAYRTAVVFGAAAVIAVSAGLAIYLGRSASPDRPHAPLAYFYDQNTKALFVAPGRSGPIETESGPYQGEPAGVRAHVFACGRCTEATSRFIGWLSKPAPIANGAERTPAAEELIRRPHDSKWVPADSPEADQIIRDVYLRCARGVAIQYCAPEPGAE